MRDNLINILTYTVPHRKTYDTLCRLKACGYNNVNVFAHDFTYQKKFSPIYEHRPSSDNVVSTQIVCENFGYNYNKINNYDEISFCKEDIFLICGAGLLPEKFINSCIVINAHPGYIPQVRGLDSLKWAIIEKKLIGVTTHLIDAQEIDYGKIIERKIIPVYDNDSFHSLAQRQYETEIKMLVDAIEKINEAKFYSEESLGEAHRRMNMEIELNLMKEFEEYKKLYFKTQNTLEEIK
ncbi:MAG: phosphoribosylglycinamide formyltransferase [Oscillospiraceae bacterium]|nr:phosphoribosylglycinamide formyltransferase [Oscillospiraceae bacterium]